MLVASATEREWEHVGVIEQPAGQSESNEQSGVFALPLPSGARVLSVEDDPSTRRALQRALTAAGFEVMLAADVPEALRLIETSPPDFAILDFDVPGGGGLAVAHELRARHGEAVHIAILSGHGDEVHQTAAFQAGVDDYLPKPIRVKDLSRRIGAAMRKRHAFVEARRAREHADQLRVYSAEAAALLAHDLNNGLAIGLSNASYLAESLALEGDERQALEATLRSLRRMAGLVANFVDISRFEDGVVKPTATDVEVGQLLVDVLAMHVGNAAQLEVSCPAGLVARFDAALVERVLHNLVGNAMRYCPKGGWVKVTARPLELPDHDPGVELVIANTGPQIPAEIADNLFSKYGCGRNGKRGLGLYFCRLACEAHGGSIAMVQMPDGPSFRIRLPGAARG